MMATTYVPIQSVTLASSAASVTFSSIPQTYTDLVVRISARSNFGVTQTLAEVIVNGDSSAIYSQTSLYGNGSTAGSQRSSGQAYIADFYAEGNAATASTFGSAEYYLPNYAGSTIKPGNMLSTVENNATTAFLSTNAPLINSTSAVTSIRFGIGGAYNFVAGSTFHLYGIKNS